MVAQSKLERELSGKRRISAKLRIAAGVLSSVVALGSLANAKDFTITIPRRSQLTPVQRLNREGVEALRKQNYEKAESLFYKAYLYDPDDPFTLNNLGYISELKGQIDRAQRYYALAAQQTTEAVIDVASSKRVEGRSVNEALAIPESPIQINHDNVEAVRLLSQGRAPEVDVLLKQTLARDPKNVFTLNNLGVANEMEGESEQALKYYDAAAAMSSDATAVVTLDHSWRGKPVAEMAAKNAQELRSRLESKRTLEAQVAELNLRGVSAINRNELREANQDFRKAYSIDPNNAFAMNNIGYVSEIEGDRETAQFFYDSAARAGGANRKVGLATRRSAEGMRLLQVAADSDSKVETGITQEREARRQQREPILLHRRDNSVVEEPSTPAAPSTSNPQ
jgi:Flp pilus assembly protein TadD